MSLLDELNDHSNDTLSELTTALLRCLGHLPANYCYCGPPRDCDIFEDEEVEKALRTYADNGKVRHCATLGVRTSGTSFVENEDTFAGLMASSGLNQLLIDNPQAFDWPNDPIAARPTMSVKTTHRKMLVDQARNPFTAGLDPRDFTSGHYKMGAPGTTDVLMDILDAAAAHPLSPIIVFHVAMTATGQNRAVPDWLRNSPGATFGSWPQIFTNLLDPVMEQAERDFWYAVTQHYGNHPNVRFESSEFFCNGVVSPEPGWNKDDNNAKRRELTADIVAEMPLDDRGTCAPVFLASPPGTTAQVLAGGYGLSYPDPDMFVNNCGNPVDGLCDVNKFQRTQQDGWPTIPIMNDGDEREWRNGGMVTWPAIPNPFGYVGGETVPISLKEAFWYRGSGGVIPVSDFLQSVDQPHVTVQDFSDAIAMFGPNGTMTAQWGVTPIAP